MVHYDDMNCHLRLTTNDRIMEPASTLLVDGSISLITCLLAEARKKELNPSQTDYVDLGQGQY